MWMFGYSCMGFMKSFIDVKNVAREERKVNLRFVGGWKENGWRSKKDYLGNRRIMNIDVMEYKGEECFREVERGG